MKITKETLRELFLEYNELYFEGILKEPNFCTYKGTSALGSLFTWDDGRKKPRLEIARNVDWTDKTLRRVLVHEMVHLYLFQEEGDGDKYHGKRFKRVINSLNDEYNLMLRTRDSDIKLIKDKSKKEPSFVDKLRKFFHR